MALATTSTFGTIKLAGDLAGSTDANAPALSASGATPGSYTNPNITLNSKGVVTSISSGSNIDIFSTPAATAGTPGVVSIGSGLTVSGGVVSAPVATTSSVGVVQVGTGLSVTGGGVLSVNTSMYPSLANGGTFSAAVNTAVVASSVSGSTTLNFAATNVFKLTLTGNITLNLPTSLVPGGVYYIALIQDATGSRTWTPAAEYKFESGSPTTLSTAANAIDLLRVVVVSSTVLACRLYKAFA